MLKKYIVTAAALLLTLGCAPQNAVVSQNHPPTGATTDKVQRPTPHPARQSFWSSRKYLKGRDTTADTDKSATDLWQRISNDTALAPPYDDPRVDRYLGWYRNNQLYFDRVTQHSPLYLHYVVSELNARGLPLELALLPFIESAYDPFAVSPSNASGLWQFIPQTADIMGLVHSQWYDGRRDVVDSTRAAITYLTYLHQRFGEDWLLALAAYNGGEGVVRRAMEANKRVGKSTDFWSLSLSDETRAYVPKLLALASVVREPKKYGVTLPAIANEPYFTEIDARSRIDLAYMAQVSGINADIMRYLNPGYRNQVTPPSGPHRILIPSAATQVFQQRLNSAPAPGQAIGIRSATDTLAAASHSSTTSRPTAAAQGGRYKVVQGDSLWRIAGRFKVDPKTLARDNGLEPVALLQPGQMLTVNTGNQPQTLKRVNYKVQPGDSLFNISRTYQIAIRDILQWNDLPSHNLLVPGQQLKLFLRL